MHLQGMKESILQKSIIDYLALKGYIAFKVPAGLIKTGERFVRLGTAGTADIIACSPAGRFIAIECKLKGNKPTPLQLDFLDRIHQKNGIAIVAFSIDDVIKML